MTTVDAPGTTRTCQVGANLFAIAAPGWQNPIAAEAAPTGRNAPGTTRTCQVGANSFANALPVINGFKMPVILPAMG
jgi:hypothetical protein